MTTIVDTTVWVDFLNGVDIPQVTKLEQLIQQGDVALGDIIVCEVLQGITDDADFEWVRNEFANFTIHAMVGEEIAIKSARNCRALRAKGITVRKTIDCLIATFCIENGFYLLHKDRDFDHFERHLGLKVIHEAS
jgi:predicted nucleic acid-binding protein